MTKEQYEKASRKLSLKLGFANIPGVLGLLLFILYVKPKEDDISMFYALLVYCAYTLIFAIPYFINLNKLTKEYNQQEYQKFIDENSDEEQ